MLNVCSPDFVSGVFISRWLLLLLLSSSSFCFVLLVNIACDTSVDSREHKSVRSHQESTSGSTTSTGIESVSSSVENHVVTEDPKLAHVCSCRPEDVDHSSCVTPTDQRRGPEVGESEEVRPDATTAAECSSPSPPSTGRKVKDHLESSTHPSDMSH